MRTRAARWTWRQVATARRRLARSGSARSALGSIDAGRRSDLERWTELTAARHDRYRAAHPCPIGRTAVICVSMRPDNVAMVVENLARQDLTDLELVFVANGAGFDFDSLAADLSSFASVVIDAPPTGTTLGAGLNRGLGLTDARFVAKFDDDDLYGRHYLSDSLRAFGYAGAGLVGKHTYYAHLVATDETVLRFPGHEFSYGSTLAGGTLVIDRDVVGEQQFPDLSIGEDRAFIGTCLRRGIPVFSADRFNFTQRRTSGNTWRMPRDRFIRRSIVLGPGHRSDEIDR